MKQRSKVIATSIATIAMCASLAVGGTFALFTSEHEVNIAVTSGTVDVKASVNEESLKTYSMGAIQEKGKFQNGGTAGFNAESKLELSLMTPGDKAEFTVDIANNSNVAIQYKVTFGVSGGLAGVLDCDATNAEDTWIFAEAGKAIDSVAVSVELPESVGNEYQNVTDTTISVKVEAVQGNANVGGATIEDSDKDVALENVLSEDLLKKEDIVVKLGEANLTWETGGGHGSTPFGNENTKTLTIIGESPDVSKLTATGEGVGPIRVDNGTLTIQNVEIVDETVSYAESSWEFTYLELGDGNADTLVFENCVFNKGIQLSGNATFKNCKFNSNEDNEYAVWVDNGSASFEDCYFAGPRGLKMHEDYGSEIVSVTVENCTFESIAKKPGIAMGTLNAETTVTIKNSQFIDCQAGDQGLYMYETDTDVNTFTFVNENNFVATIVTDGLYKMADGSYAVTNANGLGWFSAKSLTGNNNVAEVATISLLNDIDMQGANFSAIIAQRGDTLNFNGNGYTISNVNVVSGDNDNTTGQASLFYAYPNSTLNVSNLVISNVTVTADANGTGYAAAVVGYAEGNVVLNNVDVINATVKGVKSSGALVGHLSGSLTATDCNVTSSSVTLVDFAEEANGHYAGKVLGTLAGLAKLTGCEFDVTVSGNLNESNIGDVYGRKTEAGSLTINGVAQA